MSRIVVDLNESKKIENERIEKSEGVNSPGFGDYQKPKMRGTVSRIFRVLAILLITVLVVGAVGGYFYWQHLKTTPQYSLALLIDAARRGDRKTVDDLVDADRIVDDFMPQITDKAVELYGRGVPPQTIAKIAQVAAPILPSIKVRARTEIPDLIRDKTQKFDKVPFWGIVVGAKTYLEITQEGDKAFINSKLPDSPLNLTMKRDGTKWRVAGVTDEELARRIAEKIGRQIIITANKGGIGKTGTQFGVENLTNLVKELDGIFK